MRFVLNVVLVLIGAAAAFAAYMALNLSGALTTSRTVADHAALLAADMRLHFPSGDGPFPTVVMFHGCGSAEASQDDWAETFVEHGYGAIIVDSLAPRGISRIQALSTVCTAAQLPGRERAGDVVAALAHVRTLPQVQADHLYVAGWSHGGWAIMDLMTLPRDVPPPNLRSMPRDPLAGVRGAIFVYPYTSFPARSASEPWRHDIPVIAFAGSADTVADPGDTAAAFDFQRVHGAEIQFEIFDGATHDFDVSRDEFLHQGTFDEAAATRARLLTIEFLDRLSAD